MSEGTTCTRKVTSFGELDFDNINFIIFSNIGDENEWPTESNLF